MTQFFKEYGLVGVLLVVALAGYFLLGENRSDILSQAVDSIGDRLVSLVDGADAKAKAADSFAAFKKQVEEKNVAPEDVERIAADVLNLSASGATLSPEDVELVFDLALEGGANALPSPGEEAVAVGGAPEVADLTPSGPAEPARPWTTQREADVGERVSAMIAFSDRMERAASTEALDDAALHLQYIVDGGLRVVLDSVAVALQDADLKEIAAELEREKRVVWKRGLADSRRSHFDQLRKRKEMIERTRNASGDLNPDEAGKIMMLERLNRLQEKGAVFERDSTLIRLRMDLILKEALKGLGEELEKAASGTIREESGSS